MYLLRLYDQRCKPCLIMHLMDPLGWLRISHCWLVEHRSFRDVLGSLVRTRSWHFLVDRCYDENASACRYSQRETVATKSWINWRYYAFFIPFFVIAIPFHTGTFAETIWMTMKYNRCCRVQWNLFYRMHIKRKQWSRPPLPNFVSRSMVSSHELPLCRIIKS